MFNFSKRLPLDEYTAVVDRVPILCVDAIIVHKGQFLLVKRRNEPLKGEWWVPGGRVYKGETMEMSLKRKVKEELGIEIRSLKAVGYYEEHFEASEIPSRTGIHTMSVVFICSPRSLEIRLDNQSSDYTFRENLPTRFVVKPF